MKLKDTSKFRMLGECTSNYFNKWPVSKRLSVYDAYIPSFKMDDDKHIHTLPVNSSEIEPGVSEVLRLLKVFSGGLAGGDVGMVLQEEVQRRGTRLLRTQHHHVGETRAVLALGPDV